MCTQFRRITSYAVVLEFALLAMAQLCAAQDQKDFVSPGNPGASQQPNTSEQPKTPEQDVWNSDAMRDARAFLDISFKRSATVSPQEARRYMERLKALSPAAMEDWLARFQEERRQVRQAYEQDRELQQRVVMERMQQQQLRQMWNPYEDLRAVVPGSSTAASAYAANTPKVTPTPLPDHPYPYLRPLRPLVTSNEMAEYVVAGRLGPGYALGYAY